MTMYYNWKVTLRMVLKLSDVYMEMYYSLNVTKGSMSAKIEHLIYDINKHLLHG